MGALYWFICTTSAVAPAIPGHGAIQRDFNRQASAALTSLSKRRRQVGDLLVRPVATPIANHLLCDGTAVGRTEFPQLFEVIGTEWGVGDGTTTFNIPNLIGATLPNATTAPAQVIEQSTVTNVDQTVTEPVDPGETGGSQGGNTPSGARDTYYDEYYDYYYGYY